VAAIPLVVAHAVTRGSRVRVRDDLSRLMLTFLSSTPVLLEPILGDLGNAESLP
jgi:hypothetical protein